MFWCFDDQRVSFLRPPFPLSALSPHAVVGANIFIFVCQMHTPCYVARRCVRAAFRCTPIKTAVICVAVRFRFVNNRRSCRAIISLIAFAVRFCGRLFSLVDSCSIFNVFSFCEVSDGSAEYSVVRCVSPIRVFWISDFSSRTARSIYRRLKQEKRLHAAHAFQPIAFCRVVGK